jgi:hypothetical protein
MYRQRAKDILHALPQLKSSYELTHGRFRNKLQGPEDARRFVGFLKFLSTILHQGLGFIKAVAHLWRKDALENMGYVGGDSKVPPPHPDPHMRAFVTPPRTSSLIRRFAASSLARAVPWKMSHTFQKEIDKKVADWTKRPVKASLEELANLELFAERLFRTLKERPRAPINASLAQELGFYPTEDDSPAAPAPASKASYATLEKNGGTRKELLDSYARRAWDNLGREAHPRPTAQELYHFCEKYLANRARQGTSDLLRRRFKPVAIQEVGKVRVATVHEATATHFGRALSHETVSYLARHPWFAPGLTGEAVKLLPARRHVGPLRVYSADLSAATEKISQDRAQAIARGIAGALNWSKDKTVAAQSLLGPQTFTHPDFPGPIKTTNSILLGLGFTWTILSVLNAYNAYDGDFKDRSFTVCGDDLAGYWDEVRILAYQNQTTHAGLELNIAKSFRALNGGVFCEDLLRAVPTSDGPIVRTAGVAHISQACGARLSNRGGKKGLYSVREGLTRAFGTAFGPIRNLIKVTLRRLKPGGTTAAPVFLGGDGGYTYSKSDACNTRLLLISYIERGPRLTLRAANESGWADLQRDLISSFRPGTQDRGVPLSEVLAAARAAYSRSDLTRPVVKPVEKHPRVLLAENRKRIRHGRHILRGTVKDLIEKIRSCPFLTHQGKRLLSRPYLPTLLNSKPVGKSIRRLTTLVTRHQVDPMIDPADAAVVLHDYGLEPVETQTLGISRPWGFQVQAYRKGMRGFRTGLSAKRRAIH